MMNTQEIGRVKKVVQSPADSTMARRKFFSRMPPRIRPRIMGGIENSILIRKKPRIPHRIMR